MSFTGFTKAVQQLYINNYNDSELFYSVNTTNWQATATCTELILYITLVIIQTLIIQIRCYIHFPLTQPV